MGPLISQGSNLLQDPRGCTITGATTGNQIGIDPKLGSLQDNGGPTFTRALLPGSPAIDAVVTGSCGGTDQRGVTRPQDGNGDGKAVCDIGAFEVQPIPSPMCQLSGAGTNASGQKFIQIITSDSRSGLRDIKVTEASNAIVTIPPFTPGTHGVVTVTATKEDQSKSAAVTLRVTNEAAKFTDCDPGLLTVGRAPGESPVQVLHHVAQGESHLTVVNGTTGVDRLRIQVNGLQFEVENLHDGESRTLDISSAMRKGTRNTVRVAADRPRDSSAVVIVADA